MQGEQNNAPDNEQRLFQVVQDYLAELEYGAKPNRDEWLARHPDLSPTLTECFDSLDFLRSAAGAVSPLGPSPPWNLGVHFETPLGDFRIVREIGRGGMEIIYEAVQLSLGRRVGI